MNLLKYGTYLLLLCAVAGLQFFEKELHAAELPDFSVLVDKNSPAVVNISTTQKVKNQRIPPSTKKRNAPEEPFGDLFRHFFGEGEGDFDRFDTQSLGSGFIISSDGYVLSNYHVVKDADEIIVRLSDRRELIAELIGTDKRSDLALLKIDANNLPVVKIGDSEKLKVGEWVLAIGSPFGFDHSATVGIVSAKGRSLPRENYVPFIQTDVAINPGNSGGPLFNLDGEVVGINSQIYSRTGGFMGLSFAIPINMAMDAVEQLKSNGRVIRGWLGVLIQDVTRELAESFDMKTPKGALVAKVLPDSPAEKAGFEVGDVILEFNKKNISVSSNLPPIVGVTKIGSKIPVKVIRDGKKIRLSVTIGELPSESELKLSSSRGSKSTVDNRLGVVVADLSMEQREKFDLSKKGVLVKQVKQGPASKAGLRKGDVILMINNKEIKSAKKFKELVAKLPNDKSLPILVQRRGSPVFMAIKLSKKEG